jgi:hypothetical protein
MTFLVKSVFVIVQVLISEWGQKTQDRVRVSNISM